MEEEQVSPVMNLLLFELLSLLLKHRLSQGVFCEGLDNCWQTDDSWGVLLTESFNVGRTGFTGDANSLIFQWLPLRLKHQLSQGVVCFLPWLSLFTLLWQLPILFGRGMMNSIWVCGGVACLLFCLLMAKKTVWANFLAQQL